MAGCVEEIRLQLQGGPSGFCKGGRANPFSSRWLVCLHTDVVSLEPPWMVTPEGASHSEISIRDPCYTGNQTLLCRFSFYRQNILMIFVCSRKKHVVKLNPKSICNIEMLCINTPKAAFVIITHKSKCIYWNTSCWYFFLLISTFPFKQVILKHHNISSITVQTFVIMCVVIHNAWTNSLPEWLKGV